MTTFAILEIDGMDYTMAREEDIPMYQLKPRISLFETKASGSQSTVQGLFRQI